MNQLRPICCIAAGGNARRSHGGHRFLRKQSRAVGCRTVAHVKTGVAEQFVNGGHQPAGRVDSPADRPRSRHLGLLVEDLVSDDEAMGHHILGREEGQIHAQRIEHPLLDCLLKRRTGNGLKNPAGQVEAGVVVGIVLAQGSELRQLGDFCHHPGQRIIAGTEVVEVIAHPAAGMGQQMTQGDPLRHAVVEQAQVGQPGAHRRVQVELAVFHQPHHGRGYEGFGDGADLKQGVGRDRQRVLDAGHAKAGGQLLVAGQHTHGHAGDRQAVHVGNDLLAELVENWVWEGGRGFVGGHGSHGLQVRQVADCRRFATCYWCGCVQNGSAGRVGPGGAVPKHAVSIEGKH